MLIIVVQPYAREYYPVIQMTDDQVSTNLELPLGHGRPLLLRRLQR